MPSSHTTIHVDPRADVATLADKIVRSGARKIFLVIDSDARIAYHVLNFQLLRREAESAGKDLVVISPSIRVQALAAKAGIIAQETKGSEALVAAEEEALPIQESPYSAVHLGARRVADIVPRHSKDIVHPAVIALRSEETEGESADISPDALAEELPAVDSQEGGAEIGLPTGQTGMDILRRETRIQDSAWRKFLRTRKKGIPSEAVLASSEYGGRRKKIHRTRPHIKNPFALPSFAAMRKMPVRFSFMWGTFIVVILIVAIFVASTVLPTVTLAVTPHTQKNTLQIPIHVDTSISQVDVAHHIIPGQVIQESVQNSNTYTAHTQQTIQTYATGQIRVFNQYSSAPQTLVQNTRFVSQDGLLFHTTQSIVVPGAQIANGQIIPSSIVVNVMAAETGDKYNINPSTFSIPGFQGTPKFTTFYGKSEAAMKGGFSGTATVVTDADVAQAKDDLNKTSGSQAQDKLRSHVPAGFVLLDDSVQQEQPVVTLSAQSGDRATNFTGTIQFGVQAVIFREDDVKTVISGYLQNEYKGDSSMSALPNPAIHYTVAIKDFTKGKFDIDLHVDETFASNIDTHTILTMVRGMSEENVRSYLSSYPGIDTASVTFWPFWVHSVPDNQDRISLKIQYPS